MALESEPLSTPLGGSNLDALKSESSNNVDLEDGEIDDDDDDNAVLAVSAAPAAAAPKAPVNTPVPVAPPVAPATRVPPALKSHESDRERDRERERDRRERERHAHDSSLSPWMQRRLGPTPPKVKKGKGSWGPPPPHKSSFVEEDEDDFVVHLEKALQAKAREKAQQARKEKQGKEGEEQGEHKSDQEEEKEEEAEWNPNNKKKRKRKKSRDEDGEADRDKERERDRDREPKRKRRGAGGEEDEMIFMRGGSPYHEHPGSPSFRDYDHDRSYDSFGDEEDEFEENMGGFSSRGRGRGGKMRGSGRGRGRGGQSDGGRGGGFMSKRGSKRGNSRGGPVGKSQQRPGRERTQDTICMYFMQGKCPKDADECPFSHDAQPRRKMELCKFYNMNCCAKREKCLYMHKDFPCKYFHTGRKCNSGEKCRYSHDSLSDVTRSVLLKHIELAPKEILGEFRRLTREQAIQIIDKAAKMRAEGKNPEGVDLLRSQEEDGYESGHDRAHTPMPTSPGDMENEPEIRRSRADEGRRRDHHDGNHDRDRNRDRNQSDRRDREFSDKKDRRRRKRRWDSPDNSPASLLKLQETLQRQLKEQDDDDKILDKRATPRCSIDNSDDLVIDEGIEEANLQADVKGSKSRDLEDDMPSSNLKRNLQDSPKDGSSSPLKHERPEASGEESNDDSQDAVIPSHLPKRQRELFLRIQQQQREAEHNKESKSDDSDNDAGAAEDDWYSSDDEGPRSLTDVLKNLKDDARASGIQNQKSADTSLRDRMEPAASSQLTGSSQTDQSKDNAGEPSRRPALLPTPNLTDLIKNTAIDQLLSNIRYAPSSSVLSTTPVPPPVETTSIPVGLQSPSGSATAAPPVRDPRLSRDPRSRSGTAGTAGTATGTTTTFSPQSSPSSSSAEPSARADPRRDPRAERRDPRLEDSLGSPRSEQRGHSDPRAARADSRRSSDGSNSSSSLRSKSIYASSTPILSGAGDVDLRIRNVALDVVGDTDFRRQHSQFGAGDMDLRRDIPPNLPNTNLFPPHDTDLRFRLGLPPREHDNEYAAASQGDMDLRRMMPLPFKPAPVHTAATEIDASLASHTPAPYRVVRIDIPKPDYSNLKFSPRDPEAKLDPRLRKVFGLSQSETSPAHSSDFTTHDTLSSPPLEGSVTPAPPPVVARADPRRRNSSVSSRPADPRQSRMGPGTGMGQSSLMCPSTPRVDDFDEPTMVDTDLRMQTQYGRQPAPWENLNSRGRGLLPHPDPGWMPNTSAFGRMAHGQPHTYHQQRSYTPPPT